MVGWKTTLVLTCLVLTARLWSAVFAAEVPRRNAEVPGRSTEVADEGEEVESIFLPAPRALRQHLFGPAGLWTNSVTETRPTTWGLC